MKFLLDPWVIPHPEPEETRRAWEAYDAYLESVSGVMQESAFEFAMTQHKMDHYDHRNLHDSWVESLTINETSTRQDRQGRRITLKVRMLGAYHDLFIDLEYLGVIGYQLLNPDPEIEDPMGPYLPLDVQSTGDEQDSARLDPDPEPEDPMAQGNHGDWLVDEVRMREELGVVHEVRFGWGTRWVIECMDITRRYVPMDEGREP